MAKSHPHSSWCLLFLFIYAAANKTTNVKYVKNVRDDTPLINKNHKPICDKVEVDFLNWIIKKN